jgi:hypothetical protein
MSLTRKKLRNELTTNHRTSWLLCLFALSLLLASCGSPVPESAPQTTAPESAPQTRAPESELQTGPSEPDALISPLTQHSPLPTPVPLPTEEPTPEAAPDSLELVVLHTNDNWGETEPCG